MTTPAMTRPPTSSPAPWATWTSARRSPSSTPDPNQWNVTCSPIWSRCWASERVPAADVPALLRDLAPGHLPYRGLTGVLLREILEREYGIKVASTGNRYPVDPNKIRARIARRDADVLTIGRVSHARSSSEGRSGPESGPGATTRST